MIDELKKLRELTEELTGNGYLRDQAEEWEYVLDSMPEFVCIINTQQVIKFINSALSDALGVKSKDILFNKKIFDVLKVDESLIVNNTITSKQGIEIFLDIFNSWFLCYFAPIKASGGFIIGFICFLVNITDRKKVEKEVAINTNRLQSLVNILQRRFDSVKDFLDYVLDESIKLTESTFGYIYYYNEDTEEFDLNTWSKDVMDKCSIALPQTHYKLAKTGIWGEAVRQRKPIIINDFSSDNPLKKGYPEGHVSIDKFMTVPIFNNDKIVAVIGMANKKTNYDENDILQLTLVMDVVWKIVDRRLMAERLDILTVRHNALIDSIPDIIMEVNKDKIYTWSNSAGLEFFGDDVVGKEACSYFIGEQDTYEAVQSLFNGDEKVVRVESWQNRKDGQKRLLAWWCKSIKLNNGMIGVISSARDITDKKEAEKEAELHAIELTIAINNLKNLERLIKNKLLKLVEDTNRTKKILVIDDEPDICTLLGLHLSNDGYDVICAYDSDSSIKSVISNKPDMILLDLGLKNSQLSGQEVIEKIRNIDDNLPIIIVSGTSYVDDINNALKAGAWDYISKPIMAWSDLIHIVKRNFERGALIRKSLIFNEYLNTNSNMVIL